MRYYALGNRNRFSIIIAMVLFVVGFLNIGDIGIEKLDEIWPFPDAVNKLNPKAWFDSAFWGWHGLSIPFFWALFFVFNRYIWRWGWVRKGFNWANQDLPPDLNGTWIGHIDRIEFSEEKKAAIRDSHVPVVMHIRQTWTHMSLQLENSWLTSMSGKTFSNAASIGLFGDADTGHKLNYTFEFGQGYGVNNLALIESNSSKFLSGSYVSSFPRKGDIQLEKIDGGRTLIEGEVQLLVSQSGERYLGVIIPRKAVGADIRRMINYTGKRSTEFIKNREARDGSHYHMTIISPLEYAELPQESANKLVGQPVAVAPKKLGYISAAGDETYFVTAHSPHAAKIRFELGLLPKDLHVTLGFKENDIHDRPKNRATHI